MDSPSASSASSTVLDLLQTPAKRKYTPRKLPVKKKETSASLNLPSLQEQASCIPTLYEEAMEEHSLSDYETETVPLRAFILQGTTYYRDENKNKLYRQIKEKIIGPYVGRYDPFTEALVTDIPDSDEE
jgi:hypothetical protein